LQAYLELLDRILTEGRPRDDRTGTGTLSVFGHQMRFDLSEGFPLLTTKKVHLRSIIFELLWFLKGDTHVSYLQENAVRIWNAWATPEQCARFDRQPGDLGRSMATNGVTLVAHEDPTAPTLRMGSTRSSGPWSSSARTR